MLDIMTAILDQSKDIRWAVEFDLDYLELAMCWDQSVE